MLTEVTLPMLSDGLSIVLYILGYNCDRCADNYFGNPNTPGGTCEPCMCNDNVDPRIPGGCDTTTGECLKCQYNTEGFSCERCQDGFFGDATSRNCQGISHIQLSYGDGTLKVQLIWRDLLALLEES